MIFCAAIYKLKYCIPLQFAKMRCPFGYVQTLQRLIGTQCLMTIPIHRRLRIKSIQN